MIINYKLAYPSGMATAILINSFHSPEGAEVAKQVFFCADNQEASESSGEEFYTQLCF
jgi:uncharacterized oligopeptide transporter (OPT) family protein